MCISIHSYVSTSVQPYTFLISLIKKYFQEESTMDTFLTHCFLHIFSLLGSKQRNFFAISNYGLAQQASLFQHDSHTSWPSLTFSACSSLTSLANEYLYKCQTENTVAYYNKLFQSKIHNSKQRQVYFSNHYYDAVSQCVCVYQPLLLQSNICNKCNSYSKGKYKYVRLGFLQLYFNLSKQSNCHT